MTQEHAVPEHLKRDASTWLDYQLELERLERELAITRNDTVTSRLRSELGELQQRYISQHLSKDAA